MFTRSHRATSATTLLLALLLAWTAFGPWPAGTGLGAGPAEAAPPPCVDRKPCGLRFLAQPADAEVGAVISSEAFTPAGNAVQVEVIDRLGNRVTRSTAEISIAMRDNPGAATLGGDTTANAVAGVATFADLTIGVNAFDYTLAATSPPLNEAVSNAFDIWGDVAECAENQACTADVEDPGQMSSTVTGTSQTPGYLLTSLGAKELSCGDSFNHAPSVVTVDVVDFDGPKTVTMTVSKEADQAQPNNGVSFYQVCYQSPERFSTRDGTPALFDPLVGEYRGLLPDCAPAPQTPEPPCVSSKTKLGNGAVEITVLLPVGDPSMR